MRISRQGEFPHPTLLVKLHELIDSLNPGEDIRLKLPTSLVQLKDGQRFDSKQDSPWSLPYRPFSDVIGQWPAESLPMKTESKARTLTTKDEPLITMEKIKSTERSQESPK